MADVVIGSVLSAAKSSQQAGITSMYSQTILCSMQWILRFTQDDRAFCKLAL